MTADAFCLQNASTALTRLQQQAEERKQSFDLGGEKRTTVMFKRSKWEALIVDAILLGLLIALIVFLVMHAGEDWR